MTIKERIELGKLGYSKDEINQMVEAESPKKEEVDTAGVEPASTPSKSEVLLASIDKLTKALQENAILTSELKPEVPTESLDDILDTFLK